jgi:tRNA(Glu) U13 pseudouridine synthase TruD
VRVYFVLPKGAYATTVLGTIFAEHGHEEGETRDREGELESDSEDS